MTRAALIALPALLAFALCACEETKRTTETPKVHAATAPEGKEEAQPSVTGKITGVPSAAVADLALSTGKLAFEQANFDEAEKQLRVASAGGRPEADSLLLRVSTERSSKTHLQAARAKIEARDWTGAEGELAAIPSESVLRHKADELMDKVGKAKDDEAAALSKRMEQALDKDMAKDAAKKDNDEDAPEK